jgi:hypothetical protein
MQNKEMRAKFKLPPCNVGLYVSPVFEAIQQQIALLKTAQFYAGRNMT